jgi:hypothetical protein
VFIQGVQAEPMPTCHCGSGGCYDTTFDDRKAVDDLRKYMKAGPRQTTRMLIDAVRAEGVEGASLLDIGGGVGIVQHELLHQGAANAVQVDAAAAFVRVAEAEARRRGNAGRTSFVLGDFVTIAGTLAEADVVTLDRVICCYEHMELLVAASAAKARRLYGVVVPVDRWWVQAAEAVGNLVRRLRGNPFRSYIHPNQAIDAAIRQHGLVPVSSARTIAWQVSVYRR